MSPKNPHGRPPVGPSGGAGSDGQTRPDEAIESGDMKQLQKYRSMRTPTATPEPAGDVACFRPGLFVIQQHAARRMHHDLRLELDGVLRSWAVPRGPSLDPNEKRLAVEVEDHPVDYADFEGVIPAGNYGAGSVIVWDIGRWYADEGDPREGLAKGKLAFTLIGYKLRGSFALVRTKKSPKEWLLIKHRDGWVSDEPLSEKSVFTGRTVADVSAGNSAADNILSVLAKKKVPPRAVDATKVELMLATPEAAAFSKPGWLFELKYDGYRVLAEANGETSKLLTRGHRSIGRVFPDIERALRRLPFRAIFDGELVVLDEGGVPRFERLQRRVGLSRGRDIGRASVDAPATFFAFDLLAFGEHDLRQLPLEARKTLLAALVPPLGPLRYADHVVEKGEALYAKIVEPGGPYALLEGIVGKRMDAPYRPGRRPDWRKVRREPTGDFVVVGATFPRGERRGLGALRLGIYDEKGRLHFAGFVGTGFTDKQLASLRKTLDELAVKKPPVVLPLPEGVDGSGRSGFWAEPKLVCEVRYLEITSEGLLRQPALVRMRDDKPPEACVREMLPVSGSVPVNEDDDEPPVSSSALTDDAAEDAGEEERQATPKRGGKPRGKPTAVKFSNLKKVLWPENGYTKGDLIDYYKAVWPYVSPYLRDRLLVLTRFPDGIAGKSFFQKDAPEFTPEWIETVRIYSESSDRNIDYFICNDQETLLYLANLATIPLHVWASRKMSLDRPDWTIVDFDPKTAPFSSVVTLALALRKLCDDLDVPTFIKTSGQKGLHVLIPMPENGTYLQAKTLAQILATMVASKHRDIGTVERGLTARKGRVYLDFLQNGQGKTIVGPFSVRPVEGATVSMTLDWKEVGPKLNPKDFTIKTALERLEKQGDPMAPLLGATLDLAKVLAKLGVNSA